MPVCNFKITEYDPGKPWIVRSTGRDSIELPEGQDFDAWARERYPSDRYRVQLERALFRWITADPK